MLVLSRKREEKIHVGNDITITILRIKGRSVQLGIEAPAGVTILRNELASGSEGQRRADASVAVETPPAATAGENRPASESADEPTDSPDGPCADQHPRRAGCHWRGRQCFSPQACW